MQNYNSKLKNEEKGFDIKIRTYKYALEILKLCKSIESNKINLILIDQLLRSATSIGANVIEAQAASSKRDFVKFLSYSLKSSNECKFWLCLIRDGEILSSEKVSKLLNETIELSKILASIIISSKGKNKF